MVFIAILKPCPSSPSRHDAGTRQPSNRNSAVSDARIPSLSSVLTTVKPGVPLSTRKALIPRGPFALPVWAKTRAAAASRPLLTKIFRPSSTYASPSRRASVVWFVASDPASGSVSEKQPIFSPDAKGRRKRSFCASVPNEAMGSQ